MQRLGRRRRAARLLGRARASPGLTCGNRSRLRYRPRSHTLVLSKIFFSSLSGTKLVGNSLRGRRDGDPGSFVALFAHSEVVTGLLHVREDPVAHGTDAAWDHLSRPGELLMFSSSVLAESLGPAGAHEDAAAAVLGALHAGAALGDLVEDRRRQHVGRLVGKHPLGEHLPGLLLLHLCHPRSGVLERRAHRLDEPRLLRVEVLRREERLVEELHVRGHQGDPGDRSPGPAKNPQHHRHPRQESPEEERARTLWRRQVDQPPLPQKTLNGGHPQRNTDVVDALPLPHLLEGDHAQRVEHEALERALGLLRQLVPSLTAVEETTDAEGEEEGDSKRLRQPTVRKDRAPQL